MLASKMVEKVWYVLLYLMSNSQILLPTCSFSLRDGKPVQAHIVGSNSNGSTLHIMLRSASESSASKNGCPPGTFRQETRNRRAAKSADPAIVGRSGNRPTTSGGNNELPSTSGEVRPDLIVNVDICKPCTDCEPNERAVRECAENHDRICQPCSDGLRSCTSYEVDGVIPSSTGRPDRVDKVSVDFTGKFPHSSVENHILDDGPQDININIQEAGRDERNSWYFLSLCALIGLLVFLSLVMGAYLVSVKVTSWWRYQRPVTVRRRGQSFHEDNNINMSTFVPVTTGPAEVTLPVRSLESKKTPEPVKIMNTAPSLLDDFDTENFPSTSKIHIVQFKGDGGGYQSMGLYDSYVLEEREYIRRRYANQFTPSGYRWRCHVNRDNDSSDYSDSEDEMVETTGDMFYASEPSPVLQRSNRGKYLYHSLPAQDSCGKFVARNGKVPIVESSLDFMPNEEPDLNTQKSGDPFYTSSPTLQTGEIDPQCDNQSVLEKERSGVNDQGSRNPPPKDSKRRSKKSTRHSSTTQGENVTISRGEPAVNLSGSQTERWDHHSCSQRVGGDPFYAVAAAAAVGRSEPKHDHKLSQLSHSGDNNHRIPDADGLTPPAENHHNAKCENGQLKDQQNIQESYSSDCEHRCKHIHVGYCSSQPGMQNGLYCTEQHAPVLYHERGDLESESHNNTCTSQCFHAMHHRPTLTA